MKFFLALLLSLFIMPSLFCQTDEEEENALQVVDSLYKEDQFYIGVTYNLLAFKPEGSSQNGFSSGFHLGFIKDMPINDDRTIAIGAGLGLSFNSYNQDILITQNNNSTSFSILNETETPYSKNRFSMHLVELPLEFRWRTSTATDYKFWRIYAGIKLGYVFLNSTKYEGSPTNVALSNIDSFNKFQYGLSLSAGYNTWNFYAYYGLNPIFNGESKIDNTVIDARALKLGLMFYIL